MNTVIITNKNEVVAQFKGTKLSDCIFKLGMGKVVWEKYEIYSLLDGTFMYLKGTKPCQSEKYKYVTVKAGTFPELLNLLKNEDQVRRILLGRMFKAAFDIYYAGTQNKVIKDRKYRMNKKMRQMELPLITTTQTEQVRSQSRV